MTTIIVVVVLAVILAVIGILVYRNNQKKIEDAADKVQDTIKSAENKAKEVVDKLKK